MPKSIKTLQRSMESKMSNDDLPPGAVVILGNPYARPMPKQPRGVPSVRRTAQAEAEPSIARAMTEAELLRNVMQLAEALGYAVIHVRDSRRQQVEGLPDLLMGRREPPRLIYAELKREPAGSRHTDLSPWQELWRDLILGAGHEWRLWHPSQWLSGEIEADLKGEVREI